MLTVPTGMQGFDLDRGWVQLPSWTYAPDRSVLSQVNHRPESRMRETRTSGSEGRETGNSTGLPYPYQKTLAGLVPKRELGSEGGSTRVAQVEAGKRRSAGGVDATVRDR